MSAAFYPEGRAGDYGVDTFVTPIAEATVEEDGLPLAHSPGAIKALSHGALEFVGR
jgi:hypothetical protein